ncbi:MAG: glycosyltransferase family 4 protein [Pseudomonadota bacterium]|nr:glycosyltransferase family 4 protein [Pseudomonadota bacterium]
MPRPRILGLSLDPTTDSAKTPHGKNAGLFGALDRRFGVVGMVHPEVGRVEEHVRKLARFHPDRARWRRRYNLSPAMFERRSAVAERQLRAWDGRYDLIVQLHTLLAPGTVPGARPFVLHTDNTYLLSERHYPPWAPLRGPEREAWIRLERAVYQGAAFLFPRSEWLRRSMIDDYGCDPERVIRVGGGANLSTNTLNAKRYDGQTALFVGLDFERKGGVALLRAWEIVRRRLPTARLRVVGTRNRFGAPTAGVEWIGPVSDRAQLARLYADASVFVLPSLFEPWGHVFYEAMGHGLACVASTCCAMPEIVEDSVTGLLVPPGAPEPLAEALASLLSAPDLAERMGRAAHASVMQGHTWDDVVGRMAPAITRLTSGAPGGC